MMDQSWHQDDKSLAIGTTGPHIGRNIGISPGAGG